MTALLNPGEEVIIPTPCFVSYQAEVILAGGVPVEIPTFVEDGFQVKPERVEAAITPQTKAILLGYPNNPTGAVCTREVLLEIARIAEKHNLVIVSDEVYDQLVIYLIQGLVLIHQYTIMSAPTMSQLASLEAIQCGAEYVEQMRMEYDRRGKLIVGGLNQLGLPTFEPHGAFYAFPNVAITGMDDETFAKRLLDEERVAVVPGCSFGTAGEGFVRCSYAPAYEKIEEALNRIQRFMHRYG